MAGNDTVKLNSAQMNKCIGHFKAKFTGFSFPPHTQWSQWNAHWRREKLPGELVGEDYGWKIGKLDGLDDHQKVMDFVENGFKS